MKLSYEERHAVMSGAGQFPKEFMQESLQEYYVGSSGKFCNSCKAAPSGAALTPGTPAQTVGDSSDHSHSQNPSLIQFNSIHSKAFLLRRHQNMFAVPP